MLLKDSKEDLEAGGYQPLVSASTSRRKYSRLMASALASSGISWCPQDVRIIGSGPRGIFAKISLLGDSSGGQMHTKVKALRHWNAVYAAFGLTAVLSLRLAL